MNRNERHSGATFRDATRCLVTLIVVLLFAGACHRDALPERAVQAEQAGVAPDAIASRDDPLAAIERALRENYAALEKGDSAAILALYHPQTNLLTTEEELDAFFARMDTSYDIDNVHYIGDDGTNYIVIYRERTRFRVRGDASREVVETVDTDVLMVFRQDDEAFKIFTSRSLKPGA